jgi:hypothetical protein
MHHSGISQLSDLPHLQIPPLFFVKQQVLLEVLFVQGLPRLQRRKTSIEVFFQ